ncbi:hypothetical protein EYF80_045909 [Liparis tanakae]|uniref:Uncharacterized protein n=1 Tax=Liparis tanakae TaxID=230148 RepID=A0A4Z2FRL4_9TELE|nr:hypothetical protein EYF80_045909 [Liparis tanakae]
MEGTLLSKWGVVTVSSPCTKSLFFEFNNYRSQSAKSTGPDEGRPSSPAVPTSVRELDLYATPRPQHMRSQPSVCGEVRLHRRPWVPTLPVAASSSQ